jgi:6-pyruvoyltetrahydropterin/6-carboxytetrahydropterin synthase
LRATQASSDRADGRLTSRSLIWGVQFLGYNNRSKVHTAAPMELPECAAGEFMFEVTVEDSFAAGHYLRNYKGKCENPHGHNYKVRLTLAGQELDKAGLLLDFKDVRDLMKFVIDRFDHQMINEIEPFTVVNPSAENLARYFYDEANMKLDRTTQGRVRVKNVTIFETDMTTATYSE